MAWTLRSASESLARLPTFCTTEGNVSPLSEDQRRNPSRWATSYQMCRTGNDGKVEAAGRPVWLGGDGGGGHPRFVEVRPARKGRKRPFGGHAVWVGLHFGYLHLFDADTADLRCSVLVPGHVVQMCGDGESLYADVDEELVKVSATTGQLTHIEGELMAMLGDRLAISRGVPSETPVMLDDGGADSDEQHIVILDAQTLSVLHTVYLSPDLLDIHVIDVRDGEFSVLAELRSGEYHRWRVTVDGKATMEPD